MVPGNENLYELYKNYNIDIISDNDSNDNISDITDISLNDEKDEN